MEQVKIEKRVQIVKIYYQNLENVSKTAKKLRKILGTGAPNKSVIKRLIKKFEKTGSVGRNCNRNSVRRQPDPLKIPRNLLKQLISKDINLIKPRVQQEGNPASSDEQQPQCVQVSDEIIEID